MAKRARTDIPYADRLLYQKFNTLKEHRDDAARTALKLGCVALNDTEGLGYLRLVRFAERLQQLTLEYYSDPEVQENHLNERLTQIGFVCRDGRLLGAVDNNGKPIKASELSEDDVLQKAGGIQSRQLFSGWIRTQDKVPKCFVPVLTCRIKDGEKRVEQGIRMIDDQWKVYGTRTKGVEWWMPLPEAPVEDR